MFICLKNEEEQQDLKSGKLFCLENRKVGNKRKLFFQKMMEILEKFFVALLIKDASSGVFYEKY